MDLTELERHYFAPNVGIGGSFTGNSFCQPIIDGVEYFNEMYNSINLTSDPGDVIYIVSWELQLDWSLSVSSAGETLGELLVRKAAIGVDVRVILNGHLGLLFNFFPFSVNWYSLADLTRRSLSDGRKPMEDRVLFDWSGANLTGSQHQKAAIICSKSEYVAYVGGMNFSNKYRDASPHHIRPINGGWWGWHDMGVKVSGAAVDAVFRNFADRWAEAASLPPVAVFEPQEVILASGLVGGPIAPGPIVPIMMRPRLKGTHTPPELFLPPVDPNPRPATGYGVRILRSRFPFKHPNILDRGSTGDAWTNSAPQGGITDIHTVLKKAISAASHYIYIEDQFLNNMPYAEVMPEGFSLFEDLAHTLTNNPSLKIIFVGSGRGDPDDLPPMSGERNNRLTYDIAESLLKHVPEALCLNVAVWRLTNATVHSKLVLIDDRFVSIGSANFQSRSFYGVDSELQVTWVTPSNDIRDFRVKLWAEHLRLVDLTDDTLRSLQDLDDALGIWRLGWAQTNKWWYPGNPSGYSGDRAIEFVGPF